MTPQQQAHLAHITTIFARDLKAKYARGQAEHGGNLWDRPTVMRDLGDEILDLVTYYHCVRDNNEKINLLVTRARADLSTGNWTEVEKHLDQIYRLSIQ